MLSYYQNLVVLYDNAVGPVNKALSQIKGRLIIEATSAVYPAEFYQITHYKVHLPSLLV